MIGPTSNFPNLPNDPGRVTSPTDNRYNCIAWAFDDNTRWWWPHKFSYWPLPLTNNDSVSQAFQIWMTADGWIATQNDQPEPGFKKVALYGIEGVPTHAARLLSNGWWTSKMGSHVDLAHHLIELCGPEYGTILEIFKKPI